MGDNICRNKTPCCDTVRTTLLSLDMCLTIKDLLIYLVDCIVTHIRGSAKCMPVCQPVCLCVPVWCQILSVMLRLLLCVMQIVVTAWNSVGGPKGLVPKSWYVTYVTITASIGITFFCIVNASVMQAVWSLKFWNMTKSRGGTMCISIPTPNSEGDEFPL